MEQLTADIGFVKTTSGIFLKVQLSDGSINGDSSSGKKPEKGGQLQDANPRSLHNLLFIKSTKAIAETLIYQRVTIRGPREWWSAVWPPYKILLERLSDPQSHLSSLVRELTIADWPGPASLGFGVEALEKLVGNIKDLVVFRQVLSSQASKGHRPEIKEWVLREADNAYLELVVLQSGQYYCRPDQTVSEFPVLKQILLGSPNLRVLRLGYIRDERYDFAKFAQYYESFNTNGEGPLNLQFQNKNCLPALAELGILTEERRIYKPGYNLSKEHCIAWKSAMNWESLTKLDLGNARTGDFFMIFRGHIPQLKSLKFRLSRGRDSDEDPAPLLQATTRFLDSITGLEQLKVDDWTRSFFPDLWPSIAKHGHSLTSLEVNASERGNRYCPGWSAEPLTQLLSSLPNLGTLSLAVDLLKSPGKDWNGSLLWPTKPFSLLCGFSTVESLQIRVRLPHTNTVKSKISYDDVSKLATDLFEDFFEQNAASRLELVDVQVQRISDTFFEPEIDGVAAKVTKSVRDDAHGPLDGGFEVELFLETEAPYLTSSAMSDPTTSTTMQLTALPLLHAPSPQRAWHSTPHPSLPLLSTSLGKSSHITSLRTSKPHSVLEGGHTRSIRATAWKPHLPTGELGLVTGSFDGTAGVWRRDESAAANGDEGEGFGSDAEEKEDWEFSVVLEGHDAEVKSLAFSPSGQYLATCSRDKSIWIWEEVDGADEWETVAVLTEHEGDVKCVAWAPASETEGECLASSSYDGS
ncbi:hypothetical protein V494_05427, partial [Pseudogymnoascus sp. VKM F-4513 (FW-928)]